MTADRTAAGGYGCGDAAADLAELSLGVLTGEERARAVAHVEVCEACATALAQLAAVADQLLAVHLEADPPPGFERRVLERIGAVGEGASRRGERRRRRRLRARPVTVAAFAAAAVATAVAGFLVGRGWGAPRGAVASAVAPSRSSGLEVAGLRAAGRAVGEVYAHGGPHPWLLVAVDGLRGDASVTCEVIDEHGRSVVLGSFWLASGRGSWVVSLPPSAGALRSARIAGARGAILASATFGP